MAALTWLRQTQRTYLGNAAAQRDFRVQLRGNRSMLLFGLYLAILIVVGYFKYDSIASNATMSVVQAQRELRDFYTLIVMLLAGMVAIVTPGLAATTNFTESPGRSNPRPLAKFAQTSTVRFVGSVERLISVTCPLRDSSGALFG